jgi:hypothetical protein
MISRIVDDHLLRPVVGALPFTERFASPAPTSLIGDPGWCVLHQSLASGRVLNFIGSTSGPLTTNWPLIILMVSVVIVAPRWARQNARRNLPAGKLNMELIRRSRQSGRSLSIAEPRPVGRSLGVITIPPPAQRSSAEASHERNNRHNDLAGHQLLANWRITVMRIPKSLVYS